jgi:hypothetical protein
MLKTLRSPRGGRGAGCRLLKAADDIGSAEGFQVYADPAGIRFVS